MTTVRIALSSMWWSKQVSDLSTLDGRVGACHGCNGYGEFGFDSGEGAWEMATTSKEGSRRANYPIAIRWGSDKKYQYGSPQGICNWNEPKLKLLMSTNWRTSLVPAPAVIPAPIAYIKVVAVKTLVVESWPLHRWSTGRCVLTCGGPSSVDLLVLTGWLGDGANYLE